MKQNALLTITSLLSMLLCTFHISEDIVRGFEPGGFRQVTGILIIVVWLVTGPTFHFSDTWQLIINTATTVVTFLMVFLIQNTQNRDAKAMHLKLDELIRAVKGARNQLVDLENLSDDELKKLEKQFQRLRKEAENNRTAFDLGQTANSR